MTSAYALVALIFVFLNLRGVPQMYKVANFDPDTGFTITAECGTYEMACAICDLHERATGIYHYVVIPNC